MKIFNDIYSIFHFLFGILTTMLQYPLNFFPLVLFILYEIVESRTKEEAFYDCLEFFSGICFYFIVKSLCEVIF